MTTLTAVNFAEMTNKELAAWFGVNRFADRKVALKRCEAKMAELVAAELAAKAVEAKATGEVKVVRTAAEGIAESWKRPEVALARVTRNTVVCNGEEFQSVRAAFAAFGLPDSKHIKFRMALKAEGFKTFTHNGVDYKFIIAE